MKPQLKGATPTQRGEGGIYKHPKTLKSPIKSHKNAKTHGLGLRVWGLGFRAGGLCQISNLSSYIQEEGWSH
jgi:hypothetical protein